MKIVILDSKTLGDDISLEKFKDLGEVTVYSETSAAEMPKRVKDADVIIVNKVPVHKETVSDALHLKIVALTATGYNNVDLAYMKSRGITVANVAGYSTHSVVQHTFALLFYVMEKLHYYDTYVKSGEYCKSSIFTHFDQRFTELRQKTWGIVGLGQIGRNVASVAKAFGCNVIYYSTSGKNNNSDYKRVDFDELLDTSDIISIHAPLNDHTHNLIHYKTLAKMKRTAILLNLGRGPIINESDLARALNENLIGGAGLDVICTEPMTADNPLLGIKDSSKLIITPHIAWATVEARQRLVNEVYENISAALNGIKRNVVE